MKIVYDHEKRTKVLADRGLDMARAGELFAGFYLNRADPTHSSPEEQRSISVGMIEKEVVIVVWTPRASARRIVTMWKANGKERKLYFERRDRAG